MDDRYALALGILDREPLTNRVFADLLEEQGDVGKAAWARAGVSSRARRIRFVLNVLPYTDVFYLGNQFLFHAFLTAKVNFHDEAVWASYQQRIDDWHKQLGVTGTQLQQLLENFAFTHFGVAGPQPVVKCWELLKYDLIRHLILVESQAGSVRHNMDQLGVACSKIATQCCEMFKPSFFNRRNRQLEHFDNNELEWQMNLVRSLIQAQF